MKDPQEIIFGFFEDSGELTPTLRSLMKACDVDLLVQWFVEEEYSDALSSEDRKIVLDHYHKHCY